MDVSNYDVIILDCDGVIFDSNYLKLEAFEVTLKRYDKQIVKSFINYFKNNFGISRYDLTKKFITEFLKIEFNEELYQVILKDYGQQCVELYNNANFTKNLIDFLENHKNKMLYIASGSDEVELNKVFRKRNIINFFEKIYGSPMKKTDLVKSICTQNVNKNIVMVGDAKSDLLASKDNDIDFVFMMEYSTNADMRKNKGLLRINNLGDLIE